MDYEKMIKRLEQISQRLDDSDLGLDEALKLFEEGVSLAKSGYEIIQKAEGKVTVLKQELGKLAETSFDKL